VIAPIRRRDALLGGLALGALVACGRPPPAPSDPAEPLPPLEDRIGALESRNNADIGLYAVDLASGRTVAHRDSDRFAVCSTFKVYAAARVLQRAERGELGLDDPVFIDPTAIVSHSPTTGPHAGSTLTMAQLCQAALQLSDNTAANLLLKAIGGPQAVTAFARSIGDDTTRLDRWETELNSAIPGDPRDTSTPRALGDGFRTLLTGTALGDVQRNRLEVWMRGNTTSGTSMRAGLPRDWTTADKTGAGDYGSTNDIGIAFAPDGRRLLLSVMTRSRSDDPKAPNLQPLIGQVVATALPSLSGSA
jgi:beta-lactamase class A